MKKGMMVAAGVGVVAVVLLVFNLLPDEDDTTQASLPTALTGMSADATTEAATAAKTAHFVTGLEGLPKSLSGTEVDGELEADANGHLIISNGVRRVFDYFLSTMGEEPLETILARIRAYIRHKLPATAAAEAEQLLDNYIAYKKSLDGVQQASSGMPSGQMDLDAIRNQMQQVKSLRTQYFSAEVIAAFFGDEDAYDSYTLARLSVLQNNKLSPAQRAQQLAALEAQLPASIQGAMKTVNQFQNLEALTKDWKQRGGNAAELRQIRENLVGAEAADRLETLDKQRSAWDQRMNTWYGERAAILANASLSEQDRQRELDALRTSRFSEAEQVRVKALERMHDRGETLPQ